MRPGGPGAGKQDYLEGSRVQEIRIDEVIIKPKINE